MSFQILSLSGGGFLGLYTACVLAELEAQARKPIAECFDLLAGTSIGGIIALGLAKGSSAESIRDAFINDGPSIFSTKRPPQSTLGKRLALLDNATSAKYCSCVLRSTIEAIVGKDSKIGDLAHRVVIPTVNLTKGSPQVFKTDHHPTFQRDWKVPIVDVALATSAAPTFFPLHRIGGELFADGGLYANSPDDLALHEAEHFLDQARSEISMLSVGTTTAKFSFSNSGDTDLGWMGWMDNQRLPRVMISSQQLNAEYMMRHRLKDNYLRIDHQQSPEQERFLALDVASPGAISDMKALAESSVRDALGKTNLPALLKHVAAPPAFYNRSGT
ncbi:Patatin-like phospholipase [Bradyrhizobium erythrophlei]|nr:Patatin-like phospholipase [Bradyrhizobium erythrophlei]